MVCWLRISNVNHVTRDTCRSGESSRNLSTHVDVAAHLIACGEATCTKACVYGKSPLMLAAASDNVEIMDLLLRTPAKHRLDDKDVEGCTALYYAAEQGLVAATKRLVAEGASVHTQCDRGNTACVAAAERGFLDVVRMVLSPLPNHTGRTPLHQASCFGYVHVVQFLLSTRDVDVDVDAVDNQGNSPLILAAMRKHEDVVALLLASKTARTVNACNLASKTALFYAIYNHLVDMVQLLHKHGADVGVLVEHQTLWGTGYPQYCTHDMIRVLVDDLKVDVDCTNRDGKTALFCLALAFGNKWRSIEFLLSRGANPWIMGPGGILPATGAANARVRLLLENAMQEHERFFLVEKARRLCHASRSPPRHATKRPKPDVRVSWTAADDDTMQGVLDHVVRDLNDDVFRELFAYTKVAWE